MSTAPPEPQRNGEITGFLLSLAFAGLAAVRDVYFGGLFQHVDPLLVALTAFGLCSLAFLPVAIVRDGRAVAEYRPTRCSHCEHLAGAGTVLDVNNGNAHCTSRLEKRSNIAQQAVSARNRRNPKTAEGGSL